MSLVPGSDEILFVPLGGTGEIGMNLNVYGHDGKWLIIDCGVTFGDPSLLGVDVMMADPTFIEERRKDLVGILITHAHEDHVGAVAPVPTEIEPWTESSVVLRALQVPQDALECFPVGGPVAVSKSRTDSNR